MTLPDEAVLNRRFGWLAMAVLFAFGVYLSILYFDHQVVPNSDFIAFVQTGHSMWSFELPASFKRAPVLGILQVGLSFFIGGQHPDLTAGWLLNAIMYPILAVLLYLVGRRFLGRTAIWFTLLAILNPFMLQWMRNPIAEIPLIFFMVLTFYFILRRSRWCYLFAAITTMVRYEGAGLIAVALLIDMIEAKNIRERGMALLRSFLAFLPLAFWLLGMILSRKPGTSISSLPYLSNYASYQIIVVIAMVIVVTVAFYFIIKRTRWGYLLAGAAFIGSLPLIRNYASSSSKVFDQFSNFTWHVSVGSFFTSTDDSFGQAIIIISKCLLVLVLAAAVFCCFYKRNWPMLSLVLFLAIYFFLHASRSFTQVRYAMPIGWLVLLIAFYGLKSLWELINGSGRVPKPLIYALQAIVLVGSLIWMLCLIGMLPDITKLSIRSTVVPYIALAVALVLLTIHIYFFRSKNLFRNLTLMGLVCLMIICNQFTLARTVGNGNGDIEFKKLADWFLENSQPDEKMVTSMPHVVGIFTPDRKSDLVRNSHAASGGPGFFIYKCYRGKISYVTWDSRIGFAPPDSKYYRQWSIANIFMLREPRSIGPFQYITRVERHSQKYINIFRLRPAVQFEKLAGWFRQNARPDDKVAVSMDFLLAEALPESKDNFLCLHKIEGDTLEEFTRNCRELGVTYVAWDSWVNHLERYTRDKAPFSQRLISLARAQDLGPYQFVIQFQQDKESFINLFRIQPEDADVSRKQN